MFDELSEFIAERTEESDFISLTRKEKIHELSDYVSSRRMRSLPVRLTFVCTHNSRRSQLAQIWAKVAAVHHSIVSLDTFSGGTEETQFHPNAVAAIRRSGFVVEGNTEAGNPVYKIRFGDQHDTINCFSKEYDRQPNPTSGYSAVFVCGDADSACPTIPGAITRFYLPFADPKISDGTAKAAEVYDKRNQQIAREMLYLMKQVRAALSAGG